jgi:hypothetical protein
MVGRLTSLRKFTLHFAAIAPRVHSLLRERKLEQLLGLLHALVPKGVENSPQRAEPGEVNVVSYDKLFAITSCVAGVQELVASAQNLSPSWRRGRPECWAKNRISPQPLRLRGAGLLITMATLRMVSRCSGSRAR